MNSDLEDDTHWKRQPIFLRTASETFGGLERHTIIGLLGRAARDSDATAPEVVHVARGS